MEEEVYNSCMECALYLKGMCLMYYSDAFSHNKNGHCEDFREYVDFY